jgi:hypothetical protein
MLLYESENTSHIWKEERSRLPNVGRCSPPSKNLCRHFSALTSTTHTRHSLRLHNLIAVDSLNIGVSFVLRDNNNNVIQHHFTQSALSSLFSVPLQWLAQSSEKVQMLSFLCGQNLHSSFLRTGESVLHGRSSQGSLII